VVFRLLGNFKNEKLLEEFNIQQIDPFKNDIFSLGMTILELFD
jgi:hypothetical protein